MSKTKMQKLGAWGEDRAAEYLKSKGYTIMDRNYRLRGGKEGEIDIIANHVKEDGLKTICFIEVRTRKVNDGSAERSVKGSKLGKFLKACQGYCFENNINTDQSPIQFEYIGIYKKPGGSHDCEHFIIPID